MTFSVGDFVFLISDPSRSGVIQKGERIMAGARMVRIKFGNGKVSYHPEDNLKLVPDTPEDMTTHFNEGRFVDPTWLRRALTRIRVAGRLDNVVYSMEATGTDFYAHQFKPVLKLLDSPTDALLIADEVGMGKTIEAGLIWTELRARLECNRLLVICPKTLCEKWRSELDRRFGVNARVVDAAELQELMSKSRTGGSGFAAIAGMQTLRPPRGWDRNERSGNARYRLARYLDNAADSESLLDLLVVDEAHYMRNPETLTHSAGQLLNRVSTYRVFLSATPIHLRNRDLHSLLKLIDPDTFEYPDTLDELIRTNAPIVAARDLLGQTDIPKDAILEQIESAQKFPLLADNRTLERIRNDLTVRPLDSATRAELALRLDGANQMANFIVRTRRRDVEEIRIRRIPVAPFLKMNKLERDFYDAVTTEIRAYASFCSINERFILSTPQRLLTSSLAAAAAHWSAEESGNEDEIEETDEDMSDDKGNARPIVSKLAILVRKLGINNELEKSDTKFDLFLDRLRQLWKTEPKEKVVVFSSFKPTLYYLQRRLTMENIGSELLHGSISDPRHMVLQRFRDDPHIRILLSSEVGGEGVDLQFCGIVINYDLPWNPMRIEQRVGRVDRLGQSRDKVRIVNFFYSNTIDELIYKRLYERLDITTRALGDFEVLLGDPIRNMTRGLLDPSIDDSGKKEIVDRAAMILEKQKLEKEQLEQKAGALIEYGDYVLQKIKDDYRRRRWIDGKDLLSFLRDSIHGRFPGCIFETDPPGAETHRISLSHNALEAFRQFIVRGNYRGITRLLEGDARRRYRFTSSVADKSRGNVENISQLHPLVRFAVELDEKDSEMDNARAVTASIDRDDVAVERADGIYVIGVRRWRIDRTGARADSRNHLAYVGAGADGGLLSSEIAEAMVVAAATRGRHLPNFAADERRQDSTAILNDVVVPELDRKFGDFLSRVKEDFEDRYEIRKRALTRHLESRKEDLRRQGEMHKKAAVMAKERGQDRKAQQFTALASAVESRCRKFAASVALRLTQMEAQRRVDPESEDVACIVLEVRS